MTGPPVTPSLQEIGRRLDDAGIKWAAFAGAATTVYGATRPLTDVDILVPAADGSHAVTVYTIAPNRSRDGTWSERRDEMAVKLLAEAEKVMPGLRGRSQIRLVLTPADYRARTHQQHHSFGGCAPVIGTFDLSVFRHDAHCAERALLGHDP
jgi:phytoene dehydrogenase-like protein